MSAPRLALQRKEAAEALLGHKFHPSHPSSFEARGHPVSDEMLTVAEIADRTRLSQKGVRAAIARGDLGAIKLGNRLRVTLEDFHQWVASSRVIPQTGVVRKKPTALTPRGGRGRTGPDPRGLVTLLRSDQGGVHEH